MKTEITDNDFDNSFFDGEVPNFEKRERRIKLPTFSELKSISDKELEPPTLKIISFTHFMRLGIGIFLLLTVLCSLLSGCSNSNSSNWKDANSYFSKSQLETIVTTSVDDSLDDKAISKIAKKAEAFQIAEEPQTTLVDLNSNELQGSLGKLYRVYITDEETEELTPVFSRYLDPRLPKDEKLFKVLEAEQNGLPCLRINQVEGENIRRSRTCFDGVEFKVVSSKVFVINKEEV